jgi:hypothetical protein
MPTTPHAFAALQSWLIRGAVTMTDIRRRAARHWTGYCKDGRVTLNSGRNV